MKGKRKRQRELASKPPAARAQARKLRLRDEAFRFDRPVGSVSLAAESEENAPARFRMAAFTGKPFAHPFWDNFAIDLDSLRFNSKMPILREHMRDRIVGFSIDAMVDEKDGFVIEGQFSQATADGQEVAALMEENFPWQASIAARPDRIEFVAEGASVKVNGHTLKGPGTIFRDTSVEETSFVTLGADRRTRVRKLSAEDDPAEILSAYTYSEEVEEDAMADTETQETTPKAVELSAEDRQKIVQEGATRERERVKKIQELALPGQEELAQKAIAEGWEIPRAMEEFLKDERENGASRKKSGDTEELLTKLRADDVPDLGPGGDTSPGEKKVEKFDPETEQFKEPKFEKAWDESEDPEDEFQFASKEDFLSHYRQQAVMKERGLLD